jgi:hypothetical protein
MTGQLRDRPPQLTEGYTVQENFDKRDKKKAQITFPLRHISPPKVVK